MTPRHPQTKARWARRFRPRASAIDPHQRKWVENHRVIAEELSDPDQDEVAADEAQQRIGEHRPAWAELEEASHFEN